MANAPAADSSSPNPHDVLGFLANVMSVALIILMMMLPLSTLVDPTGAALLLVLKYSNYGWAIYITIQVLESVQRDFTATWMWLFDNALAVGALIVGTLVLSGKWAFMPLNPEQQHLLWEAMVWDTVDLVTGLLIPFVIAGSIRNRREVHN